MANYQSLKAAINAVIKANGNKEITGTVLNEVLLAMVNSLGAGYQFAGVATPSTNPGTPDQKVFYIASQAGTYTNFGGAVVSDGIAIFEWNGTWTTEILDLSMAGQVQSDWTETDTTKKSYIKHKPNIPPSANVDPVPTEDSPNAVSSGGTYDMIVNTAATLFGDIQDATNVNAIESVDGKIYNDYQAGDIFFIVDNNVRKYRVALVAGTADAEHPVTISPVNFYYALNSADAINLSLTLKTVSTEQQSLSTQQKAQARTNIAAVSYDQQSLSADQQVQAQNNVMGKAYSSVASDHSGLGKLYLDKNNGSLTQAMMQATNTVYVIQYDYTLAANITIPAGCILEFDGGSISGSATLTFQDTRLEGNPKILCDVDGNISNREIVVTWFGVYPSDSVSQQDRFQKVVDIFADNESSSSWDLHMRNPEAKIVIPNGTYILGNIRLRSYLNIEGMGRAGTELKNTYFKGTGCYNLVLSNFTMTGPSNIDSNIDIEDVCNGATEPGGKNFAADYSIGLYLVQGARYILNNVCIQKYDIGFCGDEAYSMEWYSCFLSYNTICYLNYGYGEAPYAGHAGHNVHFIGGEIANYKYGFVQNQGNSVSLDDSCIEGGTYGVYLRQAGHINIERIYFEANKYDIYGNMRQTKIINNFFGDAGKYNHEDACYIYILSCQYDTIMGNVFGPAASTPAGHIRLDTNATVYQIPTIIENFVIGSRTLEISDGLYADISSRKFLTPYGEVSFDEEQNNDFARAKSIAFNYSNGVKTYLRGIPCGKPPVPKIIGQWDLMSAGNAMNQTCAGVDIFYDYNKRPAWYNGSKFLDANGYSFGRYNNRGTTAQRPVGQTANSAGLDADDVGFLYFDITLGKPIWVKSVDTSTTPYTITWVDATGATV